MLACLPHLPLAFSPDGNKIAYNVDKSLYILDTQSGTSQLAPLFGDANNIHLLIFTPDGTRIASVYDDRKLIIWCAYSSSLVCRLLEDCHSGVCSAAFSPRSTCIAVGTGDGSILIWHLPDGTACPTPPKRHVGKVRSIAFSPDGTLLASGGDDCTICIWDVQKRSRIDSPLKGHSGAVLSITFSPDGKLIYSSSEDETILCWDALSGRPVGHPLTGHSGSIASLTVSQDGRRMVSGATDRTIRIWDTGSFHWSSDRSVAGCILLGPKKMPAHIPDDGWLRTVDGGLLLYIPAEHRRAVCDKSSLCISQDEGDQPMRILWDRVWHGEKWAEVGKRL